MPQSAETMKKLLIAVVFGALGTGLAPVLPAATPAAPSAKRQLLDCMSKQMAASRTLSYIDASKSCKDLIKAHNDILASANEARPVIAR